MNISKTQAIILGVAMSGISVAGVGGVYYGIQQHKEATDAHQAAVTAYKAASAAGVGGFTAGTGGPDTDETAEVNGGASAPDTTAPAADQSVTPPVADGSALLVTQQQDTNQSTNLPEIVTTVTAKVDSIIIKSVQLNRGNCKPIATPWRAPNQSFILKFGNIIQVATLCPSVSEVIVDTNMGSWTYSF